MEVVNFFKDIKADFSELRNDPPADPLQKTKLITSLALRVLGIVALGLAAGSIVAAGFTIGAAPILGGVLLAACVVFGIAAHDTIVVGVNKSTEVRLGIEPANIIQMDDLFRDVINLFQDRENLPRGQNNFDDPAYDEFFTRLEIVEIRIDEGLRLSPHTIHGTLLEPIYKIFNPVLINLRRGPIGNNRVQPQINGANIDLDQIPPAPHNVPYLQQDFQQLRNRLRRIV